MVTLNVDASPCALYDSAPLMSDNRRHPRITVRERVWCEGDEVTLYVQVLNASAEGLFVRTANPPPVGERLRVSFPGLEHGEVVAWAQVVWVRASGGAAPPGMGLQIVRFERGLDAFGRFVAERLSAAR